MAPGMSRGPTVDARGRVVGLNSMGVGDSGAFNFLAPTSTLRTMLERRGVRTEPGPVDTRYRAGLDAPGRRRERGRTVADLREVLRLRPDHARAAAQLHRRSSRPYATVGDVSEDRARTRHDRRALGARGPAARRRRRHHGAAGSAAAAAGVTADRPDRPLPRRPPERPLPDDARRSLPDERRRSLRRRTPPVPQASPPVTRAARAAGGPTVGPDPETRCPACSAGGASSCDGGPSVRRCDGATVADTDTDPERGGTVAAPQQATPGLLDRTEPGPEQDWLDLRDGPGVELVDRPS